jgi:MoaA/NifB/PqqE/SkfB family radical SAM enzyme
MQSSQFDGALKICSHFEWLKTCLRRNVSIPVSVEFDITNRCNYDCYNCTWKEFRQKKPDHMTSSDVMKIVESCADAGIKAIVFSGGGEPLLHLKISDAIKLAKKLGLDVGLFTNGLLLKGEVAQSIAECCDWIRINLAAVTPDVYEKYHGVNYRNFEKVRKNLTDFNLFVKNTGSQTIVGIGSTVNYENISDVAKLTVVAYQTGCHYFQIKHDFELLEDFAYLLWWDTTVIPLMKMIEHRYTSEHFKIDYSSTTDYTRQPLSRHCYVHHLATAIVATGDVVFCKRLRHKTDWYLGNAKKQPLKKIFADRINKELCQVIVPQNCGVTCPYLELNDFIASSMNVTHPNFF